MSIDEIHAASSPGVPSLLRPRVRPRHVPDLGATVSFPFASSFPIRKLGWNCNCHIQPPPSQCCHPKIGWRSELKESFKKYSPVLKPSLLAPRPQERGGSVFPQALLFPLDPEVARAAEGLVDSRRDAGAADLSLYTHRGRHIRLTAIPAPNQVWTVVAAQETLK
jgi:hypothetical protein